MALRKTVQAGLASLVFAAPALGQEGSVAPRVSSPYETFREEIAVALQDSASAQSLEYTIDFDHVARVTWVDNGAAYAYWVNFNTPHDFSVNHHVLDEHAQQSHASFVGDSLQYGHGPHELFGPSPVRAVFGEERAYIRRMTQDVIRSLWVRLHAPEKR